MALDIDRYHGVESIINRWDPRLKLVGLGLFIMAIALLKTIPVTVLAFVLAAVLIWLSALPLHFVSHSVSFVLFFLVPFFIIMPFTYPGESAFTVLGIGFAWEGLRLATLIFIKALSIVLVTFVIFGSSRFDVSMLALQRLRCPKVIVQMVLYSYRYTFVFLDEMRRMHTSMRARGFIPGANRRTLGVYGHFVGTLLIRSFERTDRVYKAMLAKGYQGELHSMVTFQSVPVDYMKALAMLVLGGALLTLDFSGVLHQARQAWY
jgi:cobalt/nickel transport system permease protein